MYMWLQVSSTPFSVRFHTHFSNSGSRWFVFESRVTERKIGPICLRVKILRQPWCTYSGNRSWHYWESFNWESAINMFICLFVVNKGVCSKALITLIKHNTFCLGHKGRCSTEMTNGFLWAVSSSWKHEKATPDGWSMKISLSVHLPVQQSSLRPLGLPH